MASPTTSPCRCFRSWRSVRLASALVSQVLLWLRLHRLADGFDPTRWDTARTFGECPGCSIHSTPARDE